MILRSFYTPLIYVAKRVKKAAEPIKAEEAMHIVVLFVQAYNFAPLTDPPVAPIAKQLLAIFI